MKPLLKILLSIVIVAAVSCKSEFDKDQEIQRLNIKIQSMQYYIKFLDEQCKIKDSVILALSGAKRYKWSQIDSSMDYDFKIQPKGK